MIKPAIITRKLILPVVLTCVCCSLGAQAKSDAAELLREFITVSNAYKQVPFYVSMEIKGGSNLATAAEDTMAVRGEFYVKQEGSYARFGEFEQVVGDSLAVMVSDKFQQMILYRDAAPVISRMKQLMSFTAADSSLTRWAGKYTVTGSSPARDTTLIVLQSRELLRDTQLPKETIEMRYDPETKSPQKVVTIKRNLVAIDSSQYAALSVRPGFAGKLLIPEPGRWLVVEEQQQVFVYLVVEPHTQRNIPALVADRIVRTAEGQYKPAKPYETYRLTIN